MFPTLSLLACAAYVAVLLRMTSGIRKLRNKHRKHKESGESGSGLSAEPPRVTVLVAARNEQDNLPRLLDDLLAQDWPLSKTQIIVVNDRSEDGTAAVLRDHAARFQGRLEWIDLTELPPGISPKKHALMRGLEIARGEWVAVTDADCRMGPAWLSSLAREFTPDTGMVLAPVTFEEPAGAKGWAAGTMGGMSGIAALEFASYGVSGAAFVGCGFPVIANANNLAYRRRAFDEAGGFARHLAVVNGDDDLLVQEIHATGRWRIGYSALPGARVHTLPPDDWKHFWEQRKRWGGSCLHYRPGRVLFLALIFAFYVGIAALLLLGLAGWAGLMHPGGVNLGLLGLTALAIKTAADFVLVREGLELFGAKPLLRFFPAAALLQIPLILAAVTMGSFGGFTWKGQKMGTKA